MDEVGARATLDSGSIPPHFARESVAMDICHVWMCFLGLQRAAFDTRCGDKSCGAPCLGLLLRSPLGQLYHCMTRWRAAALSLT